MKNIFKLNLKISQSIKENIMTKLFSEFNLNDKSSFIFIILFPLFVFSTISCSEGKFNDSGIFNGGSNGSCTNCGGMQGGAPHVMYVKAHFDSDYGKTYKLNDKIILDVVFSVPVRTNTQTYGGLSIEGYYIDNYSTNIGTAQYDPTYDIDPNDNVLTFSYVLTYPSNFNIIYASYFTNINIVEASSGMPFDLSLPHKSSEYSLWRQSKLAFDSNPPAMPQNDNNYPISTSSSLNYTPVLSIIQYMGTYGETTKVSVFDITSNSYLLSNLTFDYKGFINLSNYALSMIDGHSYRYELQTFDLALNSSPIQNTYSWTATTNPISYQFYPPNYGSLYVIKTVNNNFYTFKLNLKNVAESTQTFTLSPTNTTCVQNSYYTTLPVYGTDYTFSSTSFNINTGDASASLSVNNFNSTAADKCDIINIKDSTNAVVGSFELVIYQY